MVKRELPAEKDITFYLPKFLLVFAVFFAAVVKFELRTVVQIDTSVSFWPKKVKCWHFEGDFVRQAAHWQSCHLGGSYLFMKYDVFRQNAEYF